MKKTRRILALALAVALMFAFAMPAAAASIDITDSVEGQKYYAYKIFDVTTDGVSYAYTIESDNPWYDDVAKYGNGLTLTLIAGTTYSATIDSTFNSAEFAKYLATKLEGKQTSTTPNATADAAGKASITNLEAGYYFVTSSLGSVCILKNSEDKQTIKEKNDKPGITKVIVDGMQEIESITENIGENVKFRLTVTPGSNSDLVFTVHDTMTEGLTLVDSFTITNGGAPVLAGNYTVKTTGLADGCSFEIAFIENYMKTLTTADIITIEYDATLNDHALSVETETNTAYLTFGNSTTAPVDVTVSTHGFSLVKTDALGLILSGAQFKLYKEEACTNEVKLILDTFEIDDPDKEGAKKTVNCYRPTIGSETPVAYIEAGNVYINGLADGTYWVKEMQAPSGYNPLYKPKDITITGEDNFATVLVTKNEEGVVTSEEYVEGGVKIENNKGTTIPDTGGIGTTIFYVLGSILLIGAGIILVTRRRMNGTK